MKIAFVLDDSLDTHDGVQQYIITLGNWYRASGHDVHYIVGQTKRTDIKNIHSLAKNVAVRFNKNRLSIPLPVPYKNIDQLFDAHTFDVLHVQMPYSPLFAGRLIRRANHKTAIVGTFHILPYGWIHKLGSRLLSRASRKSLEYIHDVYAVSPAAQEFAKTTMNIKSRVIPNAIELKAFSKGKKLAEFNDGKQTIVFLGRLVHRKGCMELLRAVLLLKQTGRFENRRLVVCGTGPLQKKIQSFITKHHLMDVVNVVGKISEEAKAHYLATADVAVFPSKGGESFGIVLVEAIASGATVVLGGDNAGYRYVLSDNNDVLVDPANTSNFADKLDVLLTNHLQAKIIGDQQRRNIAQFDVGIVGKQLLKGYQAVIAKNTNKRDNTFYGKDED